ncbi:hypothetical protein H0E87_028699 [Populus deltoides]|uniref:Uncharacterized protein n=1 Tax=Populus deltoides TaxID=3696 RepID=A0A8T2WSM9_POPDE|nr:hypothetical protein H0E87_028699 [Populus deltoides]
MKIMMRVLLSTLMQPQNDDESDRDEQTDAAEVFMQTLKSGIQWFQGFQAHLEESADTVSTNSRQQAVTSCTGFRNQSFDSSKAISRFHCGELSTIPKFTITGCDFVPVSSYVAPIDHSSTVQALYRFCLWSATYNLPTSGQDAVSSQSSSSQPSKPVSRFKIIEILAAIVIEM